MSYMEESCIKSSVSCDGHLGLIDTWFQTDNFNLILYISEST